MKKLKPIRIDRNDFNRILLTDLLPYETPLIFSNRYFYERIKSKEIKSPFLAEIFKTAQDPSIPYSYLASRGSFGNRELSVIHPRLQAKFINFYENYYSMILDRCSLSSFSLRYPARVASRFYEKALLKDLDELIADEVDHEDTGTSAQSRYSTSFFTYRRYNRLYQFFDSNEFLELEKQFSRYLALDVSKCFYNIYTHSIAWAVKNKPYSKKNNASESFEKTFDELMRNCNFGETNGIVVGPEISRIFAEIIFQKVDTNVRDQLKDNYKITPDQNYTVRRYIDDIYIFSNSPEDEELVRSQYEIELSKYKLYLNKSKYTSLERPFYTKISSAKDLIVDKLEDFFTRCFLQLDSGAFVINPHTNFRAITSKLIASYKNAASLDNVGYSNLSGVFLGILRRRILSFSKNLACNTDKELEYNAVSSLYLELVRSIYFVLATDLKNRNIDLACQSLIIMHENLAEYAPVLQQVFSRSCDDGFINIFLSPNKKTHLENFPLEFISALNVITFISPFFEIPERTLLSFWQKSKERLNGNFSDDFPYFEAVSLLYHTEDRPQFSILRKRIYSDLIRSIRGGSFLSSTSTFMGFLDFCSCPYFEEKWKLTLIKFAWISVYNAPPKDEKKKKDILKYTGRLPWFVNWNKEELDIRKALFRKELQNVY
ncbi:antiviral reverse transcriptase Drt3b [Marinobacter shengliensis]|uniref:antiviral reverse transcriptase Drt3b n=1 Tax=Marinobacter shengliensis TaxID=1389223 RepID=UPI001109AC9F|nr:antiviral reverse transcriptase Drt3b [Marinobacter shengliensis]